MGRISQYNRQQFMSSYVGAPVEDKSGEMVVSGITEAATPVIESQAKKLRERELQAIDQQANNALIKYSLAYQQKAQELQTRFADNPAAFPEEATKMGQELQTAMADEIADERIRSRFSSAASTVVKQSLSSAMNWAAAKQEDNAILAAKDSVRLSAIVTSNSLTKQELVANLAATDHLISSVPGMTSDAVEKIRANNMPAILDSHFSNRVQNDPQALMTALDSGEYDDVEYFTAAMKDKYRSAAETKIKRDERELRETQTDNYAQLVDRYNVGELSFGDIDAALFSSNKNESIRYKDASHLKNALIDRVESNAYKLSKNDDDAKKYITLVNQSVKNREDRAKMLSQIVDVYRDGTITQTESQLLAELARPLKTAKQATFIKDMTDRLSSIEATAKYLFPQNVAIRTAEAFRSFLDVVAENRGDLSGAADSIIKKMTLDRLAESKIPAGNIPKGGKRFVDKNGKYVWVYPDGSYKVE